MPEMISAREFGILQADVAGLKEQVKELRTDVKSLIVAIENARGGWKTVAALGTVSAAFVRMSSRSRMMNCAMRPPTRA